MLPKVEETGEVTVGQAFKLVQTASDFQIPSTLMCSNGTPC